MKRRSLPIRRTPIRKVRPGTRRGQPTSEQKGVIRFVAYERSGGRCDLDIHPEHVSGVLPFTGSVFQRWHLVHLKAKRRFGWGEDNLCGGCFWCHSVALHQYGGKDKPCPPKPKGVA